MVKSEIVSCGHHLSCQKQKNSIRAVAENKSEDKENGCFKVNNFIFSFSYKDYN